MEPKDERLGLPSASNWRRYELCAGSFQLEAEAVRLGQVAHKKSLEAASGDRQHTALAGQEVQLQGDEEASVAFLNERTLEQVERIFGIKDVPCITEHRLWLDIDQKKALSGRFDRVYFTEKLAMVIDYKTGWREPDPAEINSQLKVLAVLVGIALPSVEEIVVMIISGPYGVTEAQYNLETLSQAYREIVATLRAINNPHAAFSPSVAACRYCPAAVICKAVKEIVPRTPALARDGGEALPDGEAATDLLNGIVVLERRIEQIKAYYSERMLSDPAYQIPGWSMQPGPRKRELANALAARHRLEEFVPGPELDGLASYSIPALEKLLAKTLKLKASEASVKLAEMLGELLSVKPGNLILKRAKEQKAAPLLEAST